MARIFLCHPNREAYATSTAHSFAHYIREHSRFGVWLDTEHFPKSQITSENQIRQILRKGLNQCNIFLGLYFPSTLLSRSRSDIWYEDEHNMAIHRGMPIIQTYLGGARSTPSERSYRKRYKFHYSHYQKWKADLLNKIREVARLNNISY